jgi:hypothetical protein
MFYSVLPRENGERREKFRGSQEGELSRQKFVPLSRRDKFLTTIFKKRAGNPNQGF